ncbi:glycoside hydrolase superfamily [Gaertneriomyces semiglobifer]|nr:glycoside hydrolase superfamily [Gaertneriomyces semiglobifer]
MPAVGTWKNRTFAPYVDVMLWPTPDISAISDVTGIRHFTLAFITADGSKNPAWGGVTPTTQGFYVEILDKLRKKGGDVIVSFGGATELAQAVTDAGTLQAKYQSVINLYQVTWIDMDIEGAAISDTASVNRRNKALAQLQKANPGLIVSYTLPALPSGLTGEGVKLLTSAVANGVKVDVVNIMAMDYGGSAAPNGLSEMGNYAISAAQSTYKQAQAAGLKSAKIGITPMIGQNDVAGEIFRIPDAKQVLQWAKSVDYVAELSFWSVARDTSKKGPLYASSQIAQNDYEFSSIFKDFEDGAIIPPESTQVPTLSSTASTRTAVSSPTYTPVAGSKWLPRTFAPYVDVLLWPTLDISAVAAKTGVKQFTLGFITADNAKNPAWGGITSITSRFYLDILTRLRKAGGDAIISFGGAVGNELGTVVTDANVLQRKYQAVIDTYSLTWADFDIEGAALPNAAAVDRRNQAIAGLQKANPSLIVSYTLPVLPTGLSPEGVNLLKSAKKFGVRVDVINIMAMDYGSAAAPNGATEMGSYAIQAAEATKAQAESVGLASRIGITPMIGQNDVAGEIFRAVDGQTLVTWALERDWVVELSFWSINRDVSAFGPLYASSQIAQLDYEFAGLFKRFADAQPVRSSAAPTVAPTPTATTSRIIVQPTDLILPSMPKLTPLGRRGVTQGAVQLPVVSKGSPWFFHPMPEGQAKRERSERIANP